jgi:hypothetical protein
MGISLKEVVNGKRHGLWGWNVVRGSKGGADITTSIPDHLGMILQIFLLVVVHFPHKSRMYAWIPSVLNSHKQH